MFPSSLEKNNVKSNLHLISEKITFQVDGEEIGTIQPESDQTIRQIVGLPESSKQIYENTKSKMAPFDKEVSQDNYTWPISLEKN